jgi:acetyl-CoA carboxylase / biotin carboxylase 1
MSVLATLLLDNPETSINNNFIKSYEGGSFENISNYNEKYSIVQLDSKIQNILMGYVIADYKMIVDDFFRRFNDSQEIIEHLWNQVSSLSGRINPNLESELQELLNKGKSFSGPELDEVYAAVIQKIRADGQVPLLQDSIDKFFPSGKSESLVTFKRRMIIGIIENYYRVERAFHGDVTAESLYANLLEFFDCDLSLACCFRSHYNLQYKNQVMFYFLDQLLQNPDWGHLIVKDSEVESALRNLTIFSGPKYFPVVHVSRDILLQSKSISPIILYQQMEVKLLQALNQGDEAGLLEDMVLGRYASMDVLPKFFNHCRADVRNWTLEAYIRRTFQSFSATSIKLVMKNDLPLGVISALTWNYNSLVHNGNNTSGFEESDGQSDLEGSNSADTRAGLIAVFDENFGPESCKALINLFKGEDKKRRKVIYLILPESLAKACENEEKFIEKISKELAPIRSFLQQSRVRRMTFALNRSHLISMNYFTFRAALNFSEDSNIRNVEPALAYLLELKRITDNHDINLKYTDPEGQVHIYLAKEKANPAVQKMFVRLLIRPNQTMRDHRTMLEFFPVARAILEQMFETLESVMAKEPWIPRLKDQFICSNHLFINIIAIFFHTAEQVAQVLEHLMFYYDERFNRLGIRSAEVLMNLVEGNEDVVDLRKSRELVSQSQRVRFFFENALGLVNATEMHAYRENCHEDGRTRLDCFYGKPKHNGDDVFSSHTTISDIELRRNRVLKLGSTYIYDFPKLFTHILAEMWQESTGKEADTNLITFSEFKLNRSKDGNLIISWVSHFFRNLY